ncbi:MAG: hypothetical protein EBR82_37930 [Caulobacteraceae bacterium]|nr:hypothetical protein [Caulobacteraceae bacterium]
MASNTFRISQMIEHLRRLMEEHGDLEVVAPVRAADRIYAITSRDVVVGSTGIGLAATITPTEDYQRAPQGPDDPWTYDLTTAPVDTEVYVYKRYGGQDRGFVDQAGIWHVYEGGGTAWPIAPGGVLAWRT